MPAIACFAADAPFFDLDSTSWPSEAGVERLTRHDPEVRDRAGI